MSSGPSDRKVIRTDSAPLPRGAYSQAIAANGFVFTSGTGALDAKTLEVVGTTVREQTHQVLRNIATVLEAAGSSLREVVKLTAHLADLDNDWADFDAVCREIFGDDLPARTTVGSQLGGLLVEIDVVALARRGAGSQ